MKRAVLLSILILTSCVDDSRSHGESNPSSHLGSQLDAGGICSRPDEGCDCQFEQPPVDCYLDPTFEGEYQMTCHRGVRSCDSGHWGACELIESYAIEMPAGTAALRTGPSECNPCDPGCGSFRDVPVTRDLAGGRSDSVEYDSSAGGIVLESDGVAPPPLMDSDGDGVPDDADECDGPGAFRAADGSCFGGSFIYHTLPHGGPTEISPLEFGIQVRTADVYFLMDTTGSMGGEIANLKRSLTRGTFISGCPGGIMGAIRCTIPDAWFGVGQHDDYPISPYGSRRHGDVVYRNLQDITSDINSTRNAVNRLSRHYGMDGPESQTQALWAIATGGGLTGYLPARTCGSGRWGYPCFRPGTIPIVILFTDAPFHNGPNTSFNYRFPPPSPPITSVSGNLRWDSARDVGDVASSWRGFSGRTCGGRSSDWNAYGTRCTTTVGDKAYFRFYMGRSRNITISTEGSGFDTVLSIRDSGGREVTCNDNAVGSQSRIQTTLSRGWYTAIVAGRSRRVCRTYCSGWGWRRRCRTSCSEQRSCGNYRLLIGDPSTVSGGTPTWSSTVRELNRQAIRIITVHSGGSYGRSDANALADATSSYTSSGARAVFPISRSGSGLDRSVVNAVRDLANYSRMNISARATDDSSTSIDERNFVSQIRANGWRRGSCRGISGGSRFTQCLPGTEVDFRVNFRNNFVTPTSVNQIFNFYIEVIGDDVYVLERIPVRIIVPADVPTYPPEGWYGRDYDASGFCTETERPDWRNLTWNIVSQPAGTSVRWEIRTSETAAGLDSASPVYFNVPGTSSPLDIGNRLISAGLYNHLPFLRVRASLRSNAARTRTPVLHSFDLSFGCSPQE